MALAESPVNMAFELVERHVAQGDGDRVALRWLGRRRDRRDFSYADLADLSARAAVVLRDHGIGPGDVVAVLLPRLPELFAVALGAWRVGAVFCPLFTSFGPAPLLSRIHLSRAKLLIAAEPIYAAKLAANRATLPTMLLVGDDSGNFGECRDFRALLAAADPATAVFAATTTDSPATLHFTSGTTDTPKAALHGHGALASLSVSAKQVFGLGPDEVFWCTADPGWVTATAYGIVAPLACGCTTIADEEGDMDPKRWYGILRDEGVTAWYTTPTAIRTMMGFGAALARTFQTTNQTTKLRVAASVGEALAPDAVAWGEQVLGVPFLDTWWQTETGAIVVANLPGASRAGSMGRPLPGIEIAIMHRDGDILTPVAADEIGELALRTPLPAMISGYQDDPDRFGLSIIDGWYLSGDLVRRDADGYLWFVSRADDMIRSAGQAIGPFEVEGILSTHPAVAEIGVIGKPDHMAREVPVAYIALSAGFEAGEALRLELMTFARQNLGRAMTPQQIHFVEALPKTSSGKIIRRALRTLPDTATMPPPRGGKFDDE
jgi:acetyl-CoA synthetase